MIAMNKGFVVPIDPVKMGGRDASPAWGGA